VNTIQETKICIPISINYYIISYSIAAASTTVNIKAKICGRPNTGVSCSLCYFTDFHNDCIWACSSSKTQSYLREMAYKCNKLKLNYQIGIYELPMEQNNGNTNCTDPIYENFTNIKTQLCPNFTTGTKMYVCTLFNYDVKNSDYSVKLLNGGKQWTRKDKEGRNMT
jgi:hypothetical protein